MVSVFAILPVEPGNRRPFVLVHGAANSRAVWKHWQQELASRNWPSYAIDLRGHGPDEPFDLSNTTMEDYAQDVGCMVDQLKQMPVLVGWSMGGLVAMMVAASGRVAACVALAPSMPAQHIDPSVQLRTGEFTAEEYGIVGRDPENQPNMPDLDLKERKVALSSLGRESRLARDQRRRGVVIDELGCPLLIVTGAKDDQWPAERYDGLWLKADQLSSTGASHWGLVLSRSVVAQAVPQVLAWVQKVT